MDGNTLWFATLILATEAFSGWTLAAQHRQHRHSQTKARFHFRVLETSPIF
jgi:hypothetical protein